MARAHFNILLVQQSSGAIKNEVLQLTRTVSTRGEVKLHNSLACTEDCTARAVAFVGLHERDVVEYNRNRCSLKVRCVHYRLDRDLRCVMLQAMLALFLSPSSALLTLTLTLNTLELSLQLRQLRCTLQIREKNVSTLAMAQPLLRNSPLPQSARNTFKLAYD